MVAPETAPAAGDIVGAVLGIVVHVALTVFPLCAGALV
jgi:hypothetical protein